VQEEGAAQQPQDPPRLMAPYQPLEQVWLELASAAAAARHQGAAPCCLKSVLPGAQEEEEALGRRRLRRRGGQWAWLAQLPFLASHNNRNNQGPVGCRQALLALVHSGHPVRHLALQAALGTQ
jgi:hypothetical protein